MIQLSGLSKAFGDRVLFQEVTWQISQRERVGLTGPNGAGKTTLLRMFAGLDEPDAGRILRPATLTVGYLPQDGLLHAGRTLFGEVSTAFQPLLDLKAEIESLEARLGDASVSEAEHDRILARYSEAQELFRRQDGYSLDLKITSVLQGLGFSRTDFDAATETFSGGWQMRIALAKLLLGRPNLLLLDEPTNHLDLDARNWLEAFLVGYPFSVILVSHDRYFLDAVVTRITEVGLKTLTDYTGNYTRYLDARTERMERLAEMKRRQDEEIARIRHFVDRFRYQATKASQVQSRLKMLEKIVPIEIPPERKRVHFSFPPCPKSGRVVLELRGVRKAYGDKVVFAGADLHVDRGDRIALIGHNGAGKSTLMRLIAGVEAPDAGSRIEGHQLVTQYFAQDEAARLDPDLTIYETLAGDSPDAMIPAIRNILGGFLFSGDDVYKRVGVLSGGERTRLAVARMLLRPSNTLLLDEPTNHLDLDSKDVLLEALEDFGGTLIFVSHDRYFVDRLATKIVEVGDGAAVLYPGTYEAFQWKKDHPETVAAPRTGVSPPRVPTPANGGRPPRTHEGGPKRKSATDHASKRDGGKGAEAETRRQQRAANRLRERLAALEAQIADRERAIRDIEVSMASPGFYDDRDQVRPIVDRHQALMWEVGTLMAEWEDLQASVDEALTKP